MFVKKILGAFERNTKIEVYISDEHGVFSTLLEYDTVGDFMDDGLMNYATIDEDSLLEVEDNNILIFIK